MLRQPLIYWLPKHPVFLFIPPQLFNVSPHPSVSYRQVFRPILCFQSSSLQSDSWLYPTHPSHVTYWTPCRARGHSHSPREVEDFPWGGNHSKHMPPLTYLAWLQPMCYNFRLVFIHINTGKTFACGETLIKKYKAAAKLISNHENIKQQPN